MLMKILSYLQSTYENFKNRYDPQTNPYNRGMVNNFKEVFCTRIPPSKNNFRSKVPREPLESYQRTGIRPLSPMMKRRTRTRSMELVGNAVYNEQDEEESNYRDGFDNEARSKDSGLTDKSLDLSRILHTEGVEGEESSIRHHQWEGTTEVQDSITEVGESNSATAPNCSTREVV